MKDTTSSLLYQETMRGLPRWLGLAVFAAGVAAAVGLLVSARGQVADPIFRLAHRRAGLRSDVRLGLRPGFQ